MRKENKDFHPDLLDIAAAMEESLSVLGHSSQIKGNVQVGENEENLPITKARSSMLACYKRILPEVPITDIFLITSVDEDEGLKLLEGHASSLRKDDEHNRLDKKFWSSVRNALKNDRKLKKYASRLLKKTKL